MMRRNSLAFRLLAGAALWSLIVLAVGGAVLSENYRQIAERSFETRLQALLDGLIATAEMRNGSLTTNAKLSETRFDFVYSGWYWQIAKMDKSGVSEPILRSRSLFDESLVKPQSGSSPQLGQVTFRRAVGPVGQDLLLAERHVQLPGDEKTYLFSVGGDRGALEAEIDIFDRTLSVSLALLGLGLFIALVIQVRFGLRPLDQVRRELFDIRSGQSAKLDGKYPAEISPLVEEINELIDGNREVVERSRTLASNLAHALKTPLAVLSNEAQASQGGFADNVMRQTDLMREQVSRHLARAHTAAAGQSSGLRTEVLPVVESLERTLSRIYRESNLLIEIDVADHLAFAGEESDLQELLGNLMDNACKWAKRRVRIHGEICESGERGKPFLRLCVSDDGPGLDEAQRNRAVERGTRLDERVPGDGLGLSIVIEVVGLYGGSFELGRASLGGLEAVLMLPAVLPSASKG